MEVSPVPPNPNYLDGGDYGNRAVNMRYVETANDPRGDGYPVAPRSENCSQRQYLPQEREFVVSQGSCSHCQAHCCQRPVEYLKQPAGSRGERLERYVASVRNESAPGETETIPEVRSRTPVSQGQGATPHPETCSSRVEALVATENHRIATPPQHVTKYGSIPCQQSLDRPKCDYDSTNNSYDPGKNYVNDTRQCQAEMVSPSPNLSRMESPFIAEERSGEPVSSSIQQPHPSELNGVWADPIPHIPQPTTVQSQVVLQPWGLQTRDSVESLMAPRRFSPPENPAWKEERKGFNPASMTHLNFKEKQLAMSAVKKAAANMNCIKLFQDKDKNNCGTIGKRDFQMVMDRIGILRGMSSREIDAVFKGFSAQTDTEIDYRKFSEACKHAIDNDHRLARMAQKL